MGHKMNAKGHRIILVKDKEGKVGKEAREKK